MSKKHAKYSPSSAHRWMKCAGSTALSAHMPNTSSGYADEGTAAHSLAEMTLKSEHKMCDAFEGQTCPDTGIEFTEDMCADTQYYVNSVCEFAEGHHLMVEEEVDYSSYVDFDGSTGTSDAIIITNDLEEIQVHDLKFGRGVKVFAEDNEQMLLYALGAYYKYALIGNFKRVRMVIHQPRLGHISEWDCTTEYLLEFAEKAKAAIWVAESVEKTHREGKNVSGFLVPGLKQCEWCKIAGTCPKLAAFAVSTVTDDFDDLDSVDITEPEIKEATERLKLLDNDQIANLMGLTDLIEDWIKRVRAAVETKIFAGETVPGFKLVAGRKGHRKWDDKDAVEAMMKAMRLKREEMYSMKLITPPNAEKLLKKENPRQWSKLQARIFQPDGKPTITTDADPAPALKLKPVEDDFDNLNTTDLA